MNPENWQEQELPNFEKQKEWQSEVSEKTVKNIDKPMNNKELTDNFKDQNFNKDAKKLVDFIKDRGNSWENSYHFDWIRNLKDQDIATKVVDFNEPQVSSWIDSYNQKNTNNPINKDAFLSIFRERKPKIITETDTTSATSSKKEAQETQQVSKFVLSPEQAQKIKDSFSSIIANKYEVTKVKLIGKASWDIVTDTWRDLAKESITKFLIDLKDKWFDVSQLPTYETIKNQPWFNKEQEDKNPGNHAWAYWRALMQLTALSADELQSLSGSKIDFDINPNDVKGDENTWWGIEFFGQASASSIGDIVKEKNEILKQWTNVTFKITDGTTNVNSINVMKNFNAKIDKNSSQNWVFDISPANKSWVNFDWQERGRTPNKATLSRNPTTWWFIALVNLNSEQISKYKETLSNPDTLSFLDYCQIYTDVNWKTDPLLENLKNQYLAYEKLQNEIDQKLQERKLN